jgi:hypothetical protein
MIFSEMRKKNTRKIFNLIFIHSRTNEIYTQKKAIVVKKNLQRRSKIRISKLSLSRFVSFPQPELKFKWILLKLSDIAHWILIPHTSLISFLSFTCHFVCVSMYVQKSKIVRMRLLYPAFIRMIFPLPFWFLLGFSFIQFPHKIDHRSEIETFLSFHFWYVFHHNMIWNKYLFLFHSFKVREGTFFCFSQINRRIECEWEKDKISWVSFFMVFQ